MANKFQVSGQILTITDTVTNKTLVKSPKADLFYYIEALESTIPSIKLYDISGSNSSGGATTFSCLLSTAIDSTDTPFTVETFKTFADSNLGFKAASLETDPIFGASEAALFVSGDKAKLDNALIFKTVATYALMIADGTPTITTIYDVTTDEDKLYARSTYLWKTDGNREWIASTPDN